MSTNDSSSPSSRLDGVRRTLVERTDLDGVLADVTAAALAIPPAASVAIALLEAGRVETHHATDARTAHIDQRNLELDEGPARRALRRCAPVRIDSIVESGVTSRLGEIAGSDGPTAMCSLPLQVDGFVVGVLSLYSEDRAFPDDAVDSAMLLADVAAAPLRNVLVHRRTAATVDHLGEALRSRDVIGQAKGVLMIRRGLDEASAFEALRAESQRRNVKLRDVAASVVADLGPSGGPPSRRDVPGSDQPVA